MTKVDINNIFLPKIQDDEKIGFNALKQIENMDGDSVSLR